ncbi:Endonuclease/exonuclease/phosphatase [Cinara cedri]|uniref:Endonuclease/exonuclease/phosphatase n=1 Tax=Cinara cedri TaxID=506608 RepID=A0A5E4MSR8_9HEMI|nr:Endonuclease/exonuclease/phosphatase [Cinara cedri]
MLNSATNIILWNANGLPQHKHELHNFLIQNNIHVAYITETHLTKTLKLKLPGYSAIIIATNLVHNLHSINPQTNLQAVSIQISLNHVPLTLASVYCSPNKKIITQDFAQLFISLGNNFIAGGDFNSKHPVWGCRSTSPRGGDFNSKHPVWGCRSTSPRGKILHKTITDHNWSHLVPTGPTYWPTHINRHPDILDFFIYSLPSNLPLAISNIMDLSSDHTPVKLVIDGVTNQIPIRSFLISSPINWTHYKKYLSDNTKLGIPLKTAIDIEQASVTFVEMIQSAAKLSSRPCNNYSTTSKTILDKYPLPGHINVLIRQKRKARVKWKITGYSNDKRIFNNLNNKLKRQLRNHKNQFYDNYISNLNPTNGALWNATKKILRHIEPTPPIRRPDNSKITEDVEKSNVFAEHLATVFKPNTIQTNPQHSARVFEFLDSPLPVSMSAKPTTPNEVFFYIKHLKTSKAPGHDLITTPLLKQLPPKPIILLSYKFNSILRFSYMTSIWKHAQITKLYPISNLALNLNTPQSTNCIESFIISH